MVGQMLGPYQVLSKLGEGGMGEVYRAKDTRLGREVAIKILPAALVNDPERRSRFEREAQAVAALSHPHIVTLHEVGTSDAGPYLVLERIDGQSLREFLEAGPVPLRRLTAIAAQIADGLARAHAAGIVHRDLKPDNVMVTADGFAKILDFGLAKLAWPEMDEAGNDTTLARDTASGLILGTLGYLSPEQAAGKAVDFRADQFAIGALLYEMATGERPFRRGTPAESIAATLRDDPEPLRSKRPDVPQPLAWVVERCLAKDPNDRYASTRDLARDLADIRDRLSDLQRVPVEDAPAGPHRRPARRRRGLIAVGVAAALVAGGYWGARLTEENDELPTYRPLTFQRGIVTGARFSRDGNTVYYSAAFGNGPSQVFVTRLDGTGSKSLSLPPAHLLSVSRDTDELAVLLTTGRNSANSVGTLAQIPPIGGTPRPLLDDVVNADWAPDGKRLAVQRRDGSVEFPIGTRIQSGPIMPKVSPRGDRVAWFNAGGIQIADLEGRVIVRHQMPFAFGVAWRPDGQELWFTGSETGGGYDRALYALSLDGERRLIARVPGALTVWDVSADGRGALVSTGSGWFNIVASRQGDTHERSLDLFGRTELAGLSADGERLLLNEGREVGMGVYLRTTDGQQVIPLDDSPRALGLTPDGGWALVWDRDPIRLRLVPTSAGNPRTLPAPPGLEPFPTRGGARWSADGRRLFVKFIASNRGAASARVFMREGDGDWRPVTPEGVRGAFVVSSRGTSVAILDVTGTVNVYDVEDGAARRLDGEQSAPLYWSTDDRWLFFRRGGVEEIPARIYRRELATGRVEDWRTIGPSDLSGVSSVGNPLLARDGGVVVYISARISSELFYVRGLR